MKTIKNIRKEIYKNMTNWRKFKIIRKEINQAFKIINFKLDCHSPRISDGQVLYSEQVMCVNRYPFNTWQVGDYLEIDEDKAKTSYEFASFIEDTNIVRKFGSSSVVPSSSGNLTIPTTPSSATEVARTVTQTVLDHADRTGGIPQIEIGTDKTSIRYYPPKK
jgi:hypothetical protein